MDVVHDAFDLFADHCEPDGRVWRPCIRTPAEDDHHRFAVHLTRRQFPRPSPTFVIEEIRCFGEFSRKPFDNVQSRIGARQFTYSVPVATVEAFDVELRDSFQLWADTSSRRSRRRGFSQLCSSAVERCLDAPNCRIDQFGNFLE